MSELINSHSFSAGLMSTGWIMFYIASKDFLKQLENRTHACSIHSHMLQNIVLWQWNHLEDTFSQRTYITGGIWTYDLGIWFHILYHWALLSLWKVWPFTHFCLVKKGALWFLYIQVLCILNISPYNEQPRKLMSELMSEMWDVSVHSQSAIVLPFIAVPQLSAPSRVFV